jgi:hypothetical protein
MAGEKTVDKINFSTVLGDKFSKKLISNKKAVHQTHGGKMVDEVLTSQIALPA